MTSQTYIVNVEKYFLSTGKDLYTELTRGAKVVLDLEEEVHNELTKLRGWLIPASEVSDTLPPENTSSGSPGEATPVTGSEGTGTPIPSSTGTENTPPSGPQVVGGSTGEVTKE